MAEISKEYNDQLARIKRLIESAYEFDKPNYDRFNEFRRFVFSTSLNEKDIQVLDTLKKPKIEFNILEAYISRLRGEFAHQEPSVLVTSKEGETSEEMVKIIEVVEGNLRNNLYEANQDGFEYEIYTDLLSGGFSTAKIYTDYLHPMSFDQEIKYKKLYDPTMAGFDPLAQKSDRSDGRFCFEIFPKSKEDFASENPKIDISKLKFNSAQGAFNWTYRSGKQDILLVCDFYEKKTKKVKIVQLTNGKIVTAKRYKEFMAQYDQMGRIEMPPQVRAERITSMTTICRYRIIDDQVIEYVETDYKSLPLIYFDGNSIWIREGINGAMQKMSRPYVYHAMGAQRLKNFAGQTLANELENMIMHKWKVAKESIPEAYKEAYINPQLASTLVYNAFKNDDPNVPLPPPMEINRIPTPPEVTNTFTITDTITQNVLGSFDTAARQMTSGQLSGVAVVESASLSNAAAMPYVVGFLRGLNSLFQVNLELIPKYILNKRNMPIVGIDGKRTYRKVNQEGGVSMDYDDNILQVRVEPGVNFSVQKAKALQQIISLMQASPQFAQFMNEKGLGVLLDNIEIHGVDQLKLMSEKWQQEQQQMKQQAMQQPNPEMMKAQIMQQKMQMDAQQNQTQNQLKMQQMQLDKQKNDTEVAKVIAGIQESKMSAGVQIDKANTEKFSKAVDLALKTSQHHHDVKDKMFHRALKSAELHHKINNPTESIDG